MTEPAGRREASKQAVRDALLAAARDLFAERGFDATTVRDIAKAANVTERTFYRYFDGKEGLIGGAYQTWLSVLHDAVVARPAAEPPVVAVQRAMVAAGEQLAGAAAGPLSAWLYRDGQPDRLRRYTPRPLLQLEAAIADAILIRTGGAASDGTAGSDEAFRDEAFRDEAFRARVIGRVCVAALRSAVIEYRERRSSSAETADPAGLLNRAFEIISAEYG